MYGSLTQRDLEILYLEVVNVSFTQVHCNRGLFSVISEAFGFLADPAKRTYSWCFFYFFSLSDKCMSCKFLFFLFD